jgi:YVTN family beta-propeller protein
MIFFVGPPLITQAILPISQIDSALVGVPPFHATFSVNDTFVNMRPDNSSRVDRLFYRDSLWYAGDKTGEFRRDTLQSIPPLYEFGGQGSYSVWNGTQLGSYNAGENRFYVTPGEDFVQIPGTTFNLRSQFGLLDVIPDTLVYGTTPPSAEHLLAYCQSLGEDTLAGRTTEHFSCPTGYHYVGYTQVWLDASFRQVILREDVLADGNSIHMMVDSIEVNPTLPSTIFNMTPPHGAQLVWNGLHSAPPAYRVAGQVGTPIKVGNAPNSVEVGFGSIWVANTYDDSVYRLDPVTNQIIANISTNRIPSSIAVSNDAVWVANENGNPLIKIDPKTNTTVDVISLGVGYPENIAAGEGAVWVTGGDLRFYYNGSVSATGGLGYQLSSVQRIDPKTGEIVATIPLNGFSWGIAAGEGGVWVTAWEPSDQPFSLGNAVLYRIDPETNKVNRTIQFGAVVGNATTQFEERDYRVGNVAVGEGAVWVSNYDAELHQGNDTVMRVDPNSNSIVATVAVGIKPYTMSTGAGYLWVVDQDNDTMVKVNPKTNTVVGLPRIVGGGPSDVSVGENAVWVSNIRDGTVSRISLEKAFEPQSNPLIFPWTALAAIGGVTLTAITVLLWRKVREIKSRPAQSKV